MARIVVCPRKLPFTNRGLPRGIYIHGLDHNKDEPNRRCQIKINVVSQDFISTGVKTKLLCQEKDNDQWYPDSTLLVEEEKKITLTILEKAQELSNTC
jgi:hypothetical protein